MKQIKVTPFSEILASAKRKQEEFEALSPEEQAKVVQEREEILKQLRGPGFVELRVAVEKEKGND